MCPLQVSVPPMEGGLLQVTLDDLRRLPDDEKVRRTWGDLVLNFGADAQGTGDARHLRLRRPRVEECQPFMNKMGRTSPSRKTVSAGSLC